MNRETIIKMSRCLVKRETIISVNKEYDQRMERLHRLSEKIPYIALGEPDTQSNEWKMYQQASAELMEWLQGDV